MENTIDNAYERAKALAGKNYARVTFEWNGQTYAVEPLRLARKIHDMQAVNKQLIEDCGFAIATMQAFISKPGVSGEQIAEAIDRLKSIKGKL